MFNKIKLHLTIGGHVRLLVEELHYEKRSKQFLRKGSGVSRQL